MEPLLQHLPGPTLGELVGTTDDGNPLVRVAAGEPPRAATFVGTGPAPDWRCCRGARVAIVFVDGDAAQPLVLGVLGGTPAPAQPRTLRVAAGEELLIECGRSRIHLRADGRIEIRGEHLVSRARGPNQVKGGSVHIN